VPSPPIRSRRCQLLVSEQTNRAGNLNGLPALISVEPRGFEPLTFSLPGEALTLHELHPRMPVLPPDLQVYESDGTLAMQFNAVARLSAPRFRSHRRSPRTSSRL
jgi:hypothetical protein